MKRFFMALGALCLAFTAQAQETSQEKSTTFDGVIVEYDAIDDGWGIGLGFHTNHFELGFEGLFGDTNDYVTENSAFRVNLGGNYAYWFTDKFYIEGSAGLIYNYSTYKFKGSDAEHDHTFGFYINPRVGLQLFSLKNGKPIGVTASYRWDFNKFKTSKEYRADYFTIGLTMGL